MNIFKKEILLNFEINSSTDKVWEALTDFEKYSKWNPFITSIRGNLIAGTSLNLTMNFGPEEIQKYNVKLLSVIKNKEFTWLGYFHIPGLINGTHSFRLCKLGEKVMVERKEIFYGILVPFVWNSFINKKIKKGFLDSNLALKEYLEP